MKHHWLLAILIISTVTLFGCASTPKQQKDPTNEIWMRNINLDPAAWTRNADSWFLTGQPGTLEQCAAKAPLDRSVTLMSVKPSQFVNIKINGNFQVQIVGQQKTNSIYVLGPNALARQVGVEIRGKTLHINQTKDAGMSTRKVIVRIGIGTLRCLTVQGGATIYGRNISSDNLTIQSASNGITLLQGDMHLTQLNHSGIGILTIFGANTPSLTMNVNGNGCVNLSGHVGLQSITHQGDGEVNVLGVDTDALTIFAAGNGKTAIVGYANLKSVTACNRSCVFLYWVNSANTVITAQDNAIIGLSGFTKTLTVDLAGNAQFAGQYLRANNVYARTHDASHANLTANREIFAAAGDKSRIYFFGAPSIMSRYATEGGAVIPLGVDTSSAPFTANRVPPPAAFSK